MSYFHACVFAKFSDISGLVDVWASKSTSLLVVEHPAEGKTKRIHCHFLMEHSYADDEPYRTSGKKAIGEYFKRGNYWIASRVQKGPYAGQAIDRFKTMVYMFKGKHRASFAKNFSEQEMDEARQAWSDQVNETPAGDESGNEYYIRKWTDTVLAKYPTFSDYESYMDRKYEAYDRTAPPYESAMFDLIRHDVFAALFHRKGKVIPQAQQFKQIAGSVFLRVMEHWGRFDNAVHMVLKSWY